jgi:hypothetical protein
MELANEKIPIIYPDITQKIIDMIDQKHQTDACFAGKKPLFLQEWHG